MLRPIFLGVTFVFLGGLSAQNSKDTSTNRVVNISGEYKPKFMDVQKVESVPVIEKPSITPVAYTYNIKPHQVNTEKIVNPIPVSDLNNFQESIYPTSFIKLGYGNIRTPLAEIYLNNKQSKLYSYGLHYRFLQSNSDLNQKFEDFTNHAFKGYASRYTEIGEIGMSINYRMRKYNFYGYDTATKAAEGSLARTVSTFDANAYFN
ncbi:MAG TPA: hypothetical protein VGF79_00050, partial [Bacteroidia bacterium]